MPEVKINLDNILISSDQLSNPKNTIDSVRRTINTIKSRIPDSILSRNAIRNEFDSINGSFGNIENKIASIKSFSVGSINLYREVEIGNQRRASVCLSCLGVRYTGNSAAFHETSNNDSKEHKIAGKFINNELEISGSALSGELSGETDLFGITTAGTVCGSLLYGEAGIKNKMSWTYEDDDGNREFGISCEAEAAGALAKGKAEGNIGWLHGSAEGSVITGAISGEAEAILWKDGKFNPSIYVGAKAEGSVLQGKAEAGFGSDQYGIYGKADGDLLHAEAEAKAGAGYIGTDKNGNAQYGVSAKASAIASAAQGKVKGGITVFGIDIDVGIKGYAGAVGVEAGGSISTSGVHANVSGAFALGIGLDISVDWSDAEWIGDTADFIVDFVDDTIDFVGDVGSAAWEGITFVADSVVDALFGWL